MERAGSYRGWEEEWNLSFSVSSHDQSAKDRGDLGPLRRAVTGSSDLLPDG